MLQRKIGNQNYPSVNLPINNPKGIGDYQKQRIPPRSQRVMSEALGEKNQNMSIEQMNKNIVNEEIERIRKLYEDERSQNWKICQDRLKIENMMRVAEAQKNNAFIQNEKLKNQLKDYFHNMRAMQEKNNRLTQDYYQIKNQNTLLLQENKTYHQKNEKLSIDCQKLQQSLFETQKTVQNISSDNFCLRNDHKCLELKINELEEQVKSLENQNAYLSNQNKKQNKITSEEVKNLEIRLGNYQTAYEKKKYELEGKISLLAEENQNLQRNITRLTKELEKKFEEDVSASKQRKLGSSTDKSQDLREATQKLNEYHISLMVKEEHIQKLNYQVKRLEKQLNDAKVQKMVLNNKQRSRNTFSPRKYNHLNQMLRSFGSDSQLPKIQNSKRQLQIEEKDKQIAKLQLLVSSLKQKCEKNEFIVKKLQSTMQTKSIHFQNHLNQIMGQKNKLMRDIQKFKSKVEGLQKECGEKDRIILNYVNDCKKK